jgi:hypothetical protein
VNKKLEFQSIAFSKSFAKAENVKKAIEKRGWNAVAASTNNTEV